MLITLTMCTGATVTISTTHTTSFKSNSLQALLHLPPEVWLHILSYIKDIKPILNIEAFHKLILTKITSEYQRNFPLSSDIFSIENKTILATIGH